MQDWIEHAELVDPAVHIQTMPNLISELSSEHLKALQITDIDAISLSQMLRQEKERCEVLELELTRITQNYMKALKAQEESKYWQDKWISLKIEVAMLTHDLKVLQDERKQKDSVELASLNKFYYINL